MIIWGEGYHREWNLDGENSEYARKSSMTALLTECLGLPVRLEDDDASLLLDCIEELGNDGGDVPIRVLRGASKQVLLRSQLLPRERVRARSG